VIAREVKARGGPAIVAGDFNDVAWSHTSRLMQRTGGLLDPRVGRGLYNTFDATLPLLRYPLDHIFHTEHFTLAELRRLPFIGSDHFPMSATLCYEPQAIQPQGVPTPRGMTCVNGMKPSKKSDEGIAAGRSWSVSLQFLAPRTDPEKNRLHRQGSVRL
jgi:hypothetical protein